MKYTDKRHFLCDLIFGVKIVHKSASEIQAINDFNNFPLKPLIFKRNKSFKQLDHFTTTRQILQHQINGRIKTARTPENIAPVRDSVGRLCLLRTDLPQVQQWPPKACFMDCYRTNADVALDCTYLIFLNCQCLSFPLQFIFVNMLIGSWNIAFWMG